MIWFLAILWNITKNQLISLFESMCVCVFFFFFCNEFNVYIYSKRYPNSHGEGICGSVPVGWSSPQHTISSFTAKEHRRISPNFIFFRWRFCMSHLQFSEFLQRPASPVCSWHTLPSEIWTQQMLKTYYYFFHIKTVILFKTNIYFYDIFLASFIPVSFISGVSCLKQKNAKWMQFKILRIYSISLVDLHIKVIDI